MEMTLMIKHPESFRAHVFAVDCNTDPEDFFVENIRLCYSGRERKIEVSEIIYDLIESSAQRIDCIDYDDYFYDDEEEIW